jgi:VanZ family protein
LKASLPSWLSGLFVLLVVPFFFIGGPDAASSLLLKSVWNFGHIAFFTVLMLLIQSFKPLPHWRQWLIVTVVAIALGVVIEFAQHFVGRDSSVDDVLHNLFGVWLGLFWGQKPNRLVWFLRLISLVFIAPAIWLVIDSGVADLNLCKQFPLLNSFESRYEFQQLRGNNAQVKIHHTQKFHTHGVSAAQITLGTVPYSGISLSGIYRDWSGYGVLLMDLYNPDREPLELVLRISDAQHDLGGNSFNDRFNRRIVLMKGWTQVQIDLQDVRTAPRNRVMNMNKISNITIFAAQLATKRDFYLDNLKLQ